MSLADVRAIRVDENGDHIRDNLDDGTVDTKAERDSVRREGATELQAQLASKGIKVHFMESIGAGTAGVSAHKNPTVILRWRGSAQLTGQVIAHEIAHILTLSVKYQVDENPDGTPVETDDGHTNINL